MGSYTLSRGSVRSRPALEPLLQPVLDDELRVLTDEVERLQRKLRAIVESHSLDPAALRAAVEHTRLVCGSAGYRFVEVDEPPPRLDESVEQDGRLYRVSRLAPSPLPEDSRRCAVLAPA